jgi:F0F1-type ATP synthase assembly protein I
VAARSKGGDAVLGGTQLAVSVLLGVYVGYRLDGRWGTGPWLLLTGSALGLVVGLYSFLAPFLKRNS